MPFEKLSNIQFKTRQSCTQKFSIILFTIKVKIVKIVDINGYNMSEKNMLFTIFINGRLAILKRLKYLQLKEELDNKKYRVKMSHYEKFLGHILI